MTSSGNNNSLSRQIQDGFDRIATVMRSDAWTTAAACDLNPAQANVLMLLARRPAGMRLNEIASHLRVSAASMADTISALARKLLVGKVRDETDARAVTVMLTDTGREVANDLANKDRSLGLALESLGHKDRVELLRLQIGLIRALQEAGAIPLQRMCVSCRHFRAHAHIDQSKPHHCAFIGAAIGSQELRLECGDHEPANPEVQAANWASFETDLPPLQAQT